MPEVKPLFRGVIPANTTVYVEIPVRNGCVGAHVAWPDTVSAATIGVDLTSNPGAGHASANADDWTDAGVTVTGPAASARGSVMVNLDNIRQRRARLKIATTAVTTLLIFDGMEDY